jgi:phosphoenolpyruvate-protein phosphotransferase (PTS system enzyme I)
VSAVVGGQAIITNPTGLHARPAVKLTKLAKSFACALRLRVGPDGKWTDAKSVARVLALKAPRGQTLFFEGEGVDAPVAVQEMTALVRRDFDEGSQSERPFEGQVACDGLAEGFIVVTRPAPARAPAAAREPAVERQELERAVARAAAELERLKAAGGSVGSEIIELQIELLRDQGLLDPAFRAIDTGKTASEAIGAVLEAQIVDYRTSSDEYFATRASDLADLRDRVLAALAPAAAAGPAQEEGGIYVAEDLTPSRFLELDWSRWRGAALVAGSTASHVAILARARGVPLLVGLRATSLDEIPDREPAVLDGENGRLIVNPSGAALEQLQKRKRARAAQAEMEAGYRSAPALNAAGTRIAVQINVDGEGVLEGLTPESCDGIGLTRTEFLFHGGLVDEETQYRFYRRLLEWAAGKPVTIRTLDAGGDKPIPGLTVAGERDPFLGVRGIRLSLARPEVFCTQLRALARAAALGPLKVMLPMITIPAELEQARRLLQEEVHALQAAGAPALCPPLGIMVEVPAVALSIARFEAAFYSIGTNDLIQYLTGASRSEAALTALHDPRNPALGELIARVAAHGRAVGREVSVCGDMASDAQLVHVLLAAGVTSLSVAPPTLGAVKRAIAAHTPSGDRAPG